MKKGSSVIMKYIYCFSLMVYCHISDYVLFLGLQPFGIQKVTKRVVKGALLHCKTCPFDV